MFQIQCPDQKRRRVVIHRRKDRRIFIRAHRQSERSALRRIDGKLLHKLPFHRELDNLARLIRIRIDAIVVGNSRWPLGACAMPSGPCK